MPLLANKPGYCAELDAPGAIKETGRDTTPTLRILPVPVLCRHRARLTHLLQAAHRRGQSSGIHLGCSSGSISLDPSGLWS